MSSKKDTIKRFADKRPEARAVFGYGSGVFKQGIPVGKPQTDVIFVVDDIKKWHHDNMSENSGDYSFIGRLHLSSANVNKIKGKNFVTYVSDVKGNDGDTFKYGVVENEDKLVELANRYLNNWNINRLGIADAAILKIAIYELLYTDTPNKVCIDEAIELAKDFSDEKVVGMINGVLDKIYHENTLEDGNNEG